MTETLDAALGYAGRGWSVFPVNADKQPRTKHGFLDATTDRERIAAWWSRWPDAWIGVACGASGVAVIDVDPRDGGLTSLRKLVAAGLRLPPTLSQTTGSNGCHYVYRAPEPPVRNLTGRDDAATVPGVRFPTPGIDVRGDGGYFVAAPSPGYEWTVDRSPAAPPAWLRKPGPKPRRSPVIISTLRIIDRYGAAALEAEVGAVASASIGTRNDTLNTASYYLGQLVAGGHLDVRPVVDRLLAAATAAGLPTAEAELTIASGMRAGFAEPRKVRP